MTNLIQSAAQAYKTIAKEITIVEGRPELSQRGVSRILEISDSTLRRDLRGAQRNGVFEGGKLGEFLRSKGFEVRSILESQESRTTSFPPEILSLIFYWYDRVRGEQEGREFLPPRHHLHNGQHASCH